jgi:hypothetical protein
MSFRRKLTSLSHHLTGVLLLGTVAGCDWIQLAFLNSIPFNRSPSLNPVVQVYLGIDGLSPFAVEEAMKRGAFQKGANGPLKLSQLITPFPGTSTYSWTRTLRSGKMDGYEIEYYSPEKDRLINTGLEGLLKHITPSIAENISFEESYLTQAFDYRATGYTHQASVYRETFSSFSNSLDEFFYLLDSRSKISPIYFGYFAELDVMGHMYSFEDIVRSLLNLSDRIDRFRELHPEREFHFTLISDHGNDFLPIQEGRLVSYSDLMKEVGVQPVESLNDHDPKSEIYALAVEHVRVTYLSVHTHPSLRETVAQRLSLIEATDLSVAKLLKAPENAPTGTEWYGLWAEGKLAASFGFSPATDEYVIPSSIDWTRIGLPSREGNEQGWVVISDEEAFGITAASRYPDLFYRVRTGLSQTTAKHPADVLISIKPGWAEVGFELPGGANDIARQGFHGSLDALGTLGTVLTEQADLAPYIRSDNLLDLFPALNDHLKSRLTFPISEPDSNETLDYPQAQSFF